METPNLAIQMPAAMAHLLAHRSLITFELSVHRRFGAGTLFSADFARLRAESHHSNERGPNQSTTTLQPNRFAANVMFLQRLVGFVRVVLVPDDEQREIFEECEMWGHWLLNLANDSSRQRMLNHWVVKAKV